MKIISIDNYCLLCVYKQSYIFISLIYTFTNECDTKNFISNYAYYDKLKKKIHLPVVHQSPLKNPFWIVVLYFSNGLTIKNKII